MSHSRKAFSEYQKDLCAGVAVASKYQVVHRISSCRLQTKRSDLNLDLFDYRCRRIFMKKLETKTLKCKMEIPSEWRLQTNELKNIFLSKMSTSKGHFAYHVADGKALKAPRKSFAPIANSNVSWYAILRPRIKNWPWKHTPVWSSTSG